MAIQEESKVNNKNRERNILPIFWGETINTVNSVSRNKVDKADMTPLKISIKNRVMNIISKSLETNIPPIMTPKESPNNGALLT